jgi:hypothetical protein
MGTGSLPGVKRPGRGVDHPPPSSAEVKERAELYLYSPFGPTRPVVGEIYFTLLQGVNEKTSHPRREIHAVGYTKQTSCTLSKVMDDRGREFRFFAEAGGFRFYKAPRLALVSTQPPIQEAAGT